MVLVTRFELVRSLRSADFKSASSAYSVTPAYLHCIYIITHYLWFVNLLFFIFCDFYAADFREVPVDSKQFTFTLNGDSFGPGKDVDLTLGMTWTVINGKEEMALPYSGTFAVQSQPKVELPIANTIFTIAWNKAA